MDDTTRNASGLRPNPYPAASGGTRFRGESENGRSPEASWLIEQIGGRQDFAETQPAVRYVVAGHE